MDKQLKVGALALRQITRWTALKRRRDWHYLFVEDKLLSLVKPMMNALPPGYWLPVLKLLYEAVRLGREETVSMAEEINVLLGYQRRPTSSSRAARGRGKRRPREPGRARVDKNSRRGGWQLLSFCQ
jgi:hypothetical protein